jgi:hypothetical protein
MDLCTPVCTWNLLAGSEYSSLSIDLFPTSDSIQDKSYIQAQTNIFIFSIPTSPTHVPP